MQWDSSEVEKSEAPVGKMGQAAAKHCVMYLPQKNTHETLGTRRGNLSARAPPMRNKS